MNPDLKNIKKNIVDNFIRKKLYKHRIFSKEGFYIKYPDFDYNFYINYYDDIKKLKENNIYYHYHNFGINEKRYYLGESGEK